MSEPVYGRMRGERVGNVKVVAVFAHDDGSFTVRGTLEREQVPVVLRSVAELVEDSGEGEP